MTEEYTWSLDLASSHRYMFPFHEYLLCKCPIQVYLTHIKHTTHTCTLTCTHTHIHTHAHTWTHMHEHTQMHTHALYVLPCKIYSSNEELRGCMFFLLDRDKNWLWILYGCSHLTESLALAQFLAHSQINFNLVMTAWHVSGTSLCLQAKCIKILELPGTGRL